MRSNSWDIWPGNRSSSGGISTAASGGISRPAAPFYRARSSRREGGPSEASRVVAGEGSNLVHAAIKPHLAEEGTGPHDPERAGRLDPREPAVEHRRLGRAFSDHHEQPVAADARPRVRPLVEGVPPARIVAKDR